MSETVNLPALGESVTEGTVTRWLKAVGDEVAVDEPLVEVSTDKVDTEIPSPVAGVLEEILVEEDDTVEVGAPLVVIGDGSGSGSSDDSSDSADDSAEKEEPKAEEKSEEKSEEKPAEEAPKAEAKKSSGGSGTEVALPALGESVTEGTVTRWLKSVGDEVEVDEPLLEVSTDKVDTEIPSPVAGTLLEIRAEEDDTVEVGAVLALVGSGSAGGGSAPSEGSSGQDEASADEIEDKATEAEAPEETEEAAEAAGAEKSEKTPEASPSEEASRRESAERDSAQAESAEAPSATEPGQGYVTPLVRRLAHQNNVDLSTVRGTGVGGRIRKQDVLAAAGEGDAPAKSGAQSDNSPRARWSTKSVDPAKQELIGTTQKVNRIREITAAKMVEALQISAQLTHVQEVDMTAIWDMRKKNKQAFIDKHGANLSFLPFIVKATAEALVSHPNVNASYNPETKEMTYHSDVNIAIAVDTPKGLLTPVIHKAQDMTLPQIAQQIAELADKARNNKLKPNDLTGATFTVTNIGSEGAMLDTPILVPPQAGILGTAAIEKRPVVVNENGQDAIAIRQMCYLPFTYDHQVVDGADAGRFITTIKDRLQTADFQADLEV